MQFIKPDINVNFVGIRKIAYAISISLVIMSIISLIYHKGPRYGVDFEGGTSIQIKFQNDIKTDDVQKGITAIGLEKTSIQQLGKPTDHEYQIRTPLSLMANSDFSNTFKESLTKSTGVPVVDVSMDIVGAQVSQDLREKALFAMFFALLMLTIYISGRFEMKWMLSGFMAAIFGIPVYIVVQYGAKNSIISYLIIAALILSLVACWFLRLKYALGAIVALVHDVTITVGIFSLMNIEFTLQVIAALLTIIGYSLNDTIIVYDRIRETSGKNTRDTFDLVINRSINETLSRTTLTSLLTFMVVLCLYLFGGSVIHHFAFAMLIGIVVGTYSSIFVASPILLAFQGKEE
jgi:preprotein translocase subunit SecF